jgi:hypothetical protein
MRLNSLKYEVLCIQIEEENIKVHLQRLNQDFKSLIKHSQDQHITSIIN